MAGKKTSIDRELEKYWSPLPIFDRALLLVSLGIDGKDLRFLNGKTMDQIIQTDQDSLPSEIRGRLIMSLTEDGFSPAEYDREKESMRGRVERG